MQKPSLHTNVSSHAVGLSEMFRLAMAKMPLGRYRVEMTAPDQSTAGGARALQHVRLVVKPEPGSEARDGAAHALVVGHANVSTTAAELETLEAVEVAWAKRFEEPTGLDPSLYAAYLDEAEAVLQAFGLKVQRVGPRPPSILPTPTSPPTARGSFVWALLGGLVLTAVAAWLLLARR